MGLYDNHNHSQFSFDGKRTALECSARSAVAAGLDGICFTDHWDYYTPQMKINLRYGTDETFDIEGQQKEIDRVEAALAAEGKELKILKGIEIGLQHDCRGKIRQIFREHSFDQIIASVHYLNDTDPFYGVYYEGLDWKEAYGKYLETLYEEMVWLGPDFDIMGHYDYIVRYGPYPQASIRFQDFPELLDAMLSFLVKNGKVLEINTKTYRSFPGGRTPSVDPELLLRYKELGAEAVSLGSDSHTADGVGRNFKWAVELLRSLGFRWEAHYLKRQMQLSPLTFPSSG